MGLVAADRPHDPEAAPVQHRRAGESGGPAPPALPWNILCLKAPHRPPWAASTEQAACSGFALRQEMSASPFPGKAALA